MMRLAVCLMALFLAAPVWAGPPKPQRDPVLSARECKMLLKPERFADRSAGVAEIQKLVRAACDRAGLMFTGTAGQEESIRLVSFLDTAAFSIYRQGYVLRFRQDAEPDRDGNVHRSSKRYELTFKFRHPDPTVAIEHDTTAHSGFQSSESFEENLLVKEASIDRVYERSGKVEMKTKVGDKLSFYSTIFPGLARLGIPGSESIVRVHDIEVVEYQREIGVIELGMSARAKAVVSVWYRQGETKPLIAEFSFKTKLRSKDRLHSLINHTYRSSEALLRELQSAGKDWIAAGATKTGLIYQTNVPNHD